MESFASMSESDNVEKFIEKFKNIQEMFLDYLDNEENFDENFQNLHQLLVDEKIRDCKYETRLFLHFLLKVANHRHRGANFFSKIFQILLLFKENLKKYKNNEIFNLFKSNKRVLLFLIEEGILTVDEYFVKQIINKKFFTRQYPQYFAPEINPFLKDEWFFKNIKKELPDNFYEFRKIGENESYLCKLIREDSVKNFISYVNKTCINRNATISPSIYETNSFLLKKQNKITLIEYAAFFGSIQILTFLRYEKVELTPSLWINTIHGKNAELIHILEDNRVEKKVSVIKESIKCHHNEIADYFLSNSLQNKEKNSSKTNIQSLKYYNFAFLQKELINKSTFCHLCYYDYYLLVEVLLTSSDIDINNKEIKNILFKCNSKSYF